MLATGFPTWLGPLVPLLGVGALYALYRVSDRRDGRLREHGAD